MPVYPSCWGTLAPYDLDAFYGNVLPVKGQQPGEQNEGAFDRSATIPQLAGAVSRQSCNKPQGQLPNRAAI